MGGETTISDIGFYLILVQSLMTFDQSQVNCIHGFLLNSCRCLRFSLFNVEVSCLQMLE